MKTFLVLIFCFCVANTNAQKIKPTSNNDFVLECMKINGEATNKQIAIWIPYNFWEIVGEQMKVSPEFIVRLKNQMKEYLLFCVVDYSVSSSGMTFNDDIEKTIQFVDSSNKVYKPLADNEINDEAKLLISNLKPTLATMFGQFGNGMQIFVFNAKQVDGKPGIDVQNKNSFSLSWNKTKMNWVLPFSSVFPVKFCSVDMAEMKGTWNYCPIHGIKL